MPIVEDGDYDGRSRRKPSKAGDYYHHLYAFPIIAGYAARARKITGSRAVSIRLAAAGNYWMMTIFLGDDDGIDATTRFADELPLREARGA